MCRTHTCTIVIYNEWSHYLVLWFPATYNERTFIQESESVSVDLFTSNVRFRCNSGPQSGRRSLWEHHHFLSEAEEIVSGFSVAACPTVETVSEFVLVSVLSRYP